MPKSYQDSAQLTRQDLLPFGGFEVAVLLLKLQDGDGGDNENDKDCSAETIDFQPVTGPVSSGWLRSKMMCECAREM